MRYPYRRASLAMTAAAIVTALAVVPYAPAQAQAALPAASAFGANVKVDTNDVVPPTPVAAVATPPGDVTETVVDIPAAPVAISGTLTATANAHTTADITTGLTTVMQEVPGPYNARGLAQIENLGLVFEVAGAGVPLLGAALVRSEAAVVCGTTPRFTANSEVIDLTVAGTAVPVNEPVQTIIDGIQGALLASGLNAVVDVQRNVVTPIAGGGIGVDALVVTILSAAGDVPLATVRLAHSEVTAAACPAPAAAPPQCSDNADNDGDAQIDIKDPGCHTDGNADNAATFDPNDNDERNDRSRVLPRTGSEASLPLVGAGLATLAALGMRLRRRLVG